VTPYYEHAGITIYHGDALSVLATVPAESCDAVITDPPYGTRRKQRDEWMVGEFADVLPLALPEFHRIAARDGALYLFMAWRRMADGIIRASVYFPIQNFIVWDKGRHSGLWTAYAWQFHWEGVYYGIKGPRPIRKYLPDVVRDSEAPRAPMQKPVGLIRTLLEASTDAGQTVIDPFAGTGSTLLAAQQTGRKAIGIEIEERYCEIAAKRLSQEVLAL
jgi:DNA modification methylase